jgi:metal-responsive CopG/Arc/MetJ family transcriptional regulator
MSEESAKMMWGGSRIGAGRPKSEIKKRGVSFLIAADLDRVLTKAAEQSYVSRSEYVEEALRNRLKRDENLTTAQKRRLRSR